MTCALCRKPRELRQSHIITEYIHAPLYDGKHRTLAFKVDAKGVDLLQKGLREPLLCGPCENDVLNKLYENPSKASWNHLAGWSVSSKIEEEVMTTAQGNRILRLKGLDYATLKLFVLSLLWRAAVSSLAEYYAVELGAKHAERLRTMLIEQNAGALTDYPFLAFKLKGSVRVMGIPEEVRRWSGHRCYRLVLPGVVLFFFVSSHEPSPEVLNATLREDGSLVMPIMNLDQFPGLDSTVEIVREAQVPDKWLRRN